LIPSLNGKITLAFGKIDLKTPSMNQPRFNPRFSTTKTKLSHLAQDQPRRDHGKEHSGDPIMLDLLGIGSPVGGRLELLTLRVARDALLFREKGPRRPDSHENE
jgi:hypothetical protein